MCRCNFVYLLNSGYGIGAALSKCMETTVTDIKNYKIWITYRKNNQNEYGIENYNIKATTVKEALEELQKIDSEFGSEVVKVSIEEKD